jgi:glutathione S-transferase
MLTLYQFPRFWGIPNPSPFCLKLETYLRLAKVPYEVAATTAMAKTPKGKLPFVIDDNIRLADTSLIIDHLKKQYGNPLDSNLTAMQKAQGIMLQRAMEEHLYFVIVYFRWLTPDFFNYIKGHFFKKMPAILRLFVPALIQRMVRKQLHYQGIARHSEAEIMELVKPDIDALVTILGTQKFVFGDQPSSFDASVFAMLLSILRPTVPNPLKAYVGQFSTLTTYTDRVFELAFPDFVANLKD